MGRRRPRRREGAAQLHAAVILLVSPLYVVQIQSAAVYKFAAYARLKIDLESAGYRSMMNWGKLLSISRLGWPGAKKQGGRSQFQQDIDRIVFSAAFRRLAHKTQVHPLSENDHVHTRLTHSIEVSSVGRSLGTIVGNTVRKRQSGQKLSEDTFGYIVQAACLAHDIGNPPFGHSGEDSICQWFGRDFLKNNAFYASLGVAERNDLLFFEGNAQGLRILTQLENYKWAGGLQLTYAVLATFAKYPHSSASHPIPQDKYVGSKKIGFFDAERTYFAQVARGVGLISRPNLSGNWCRHPLAFLVEAADDICYAIIDIEDGYELGYLTFSEAESVLAPIAGRLKNLGSLEQHEKIGKLRAVAIGNLVKAVAGAFLDNEKRILKGEFGEELIAETKYKRHIRNAKDIGREKIYLSERKTIIEIAASKIISGLLDLFIPIVAEAENVNWEHDKLPPHSQKLVRLIPNEFLGVGTRYEGLLRITDFISGMTDRYALDLYRKLHGISV